MAPGRGIESRERQTERLWAHKVLTDRVVEHSDFEWFRSDLGSEPTLTESVESKIYRHTGTHMNSLARTIIGEAARAMWGVSADVHYSVHGKRVVILDPATQRPAFDPEVSLETRWTGLVQALEARLGLIIRKPLKDSLVGLPARRLRRILGPPTADPVTATDAVVSGAVVASGNTRRLKDIEFWLYENIPAGNDTRITVTKGMVDSVEIVAR